MQATVGILAGLSCWVAVRCLPVYVVWAWTFDVTPQADIFVYSMGGTPIEYTK